MNKEFAKVKKYKTWFNLLIALFIFVVLAAIFVIAFVFRFEKSIGVSSVYVGVVLGLIVFIIWCCFSVHVFIQQKAFNNSTPKFYIEMLEDGFLIKGKEIKFVDIKSITYKKIHKWEIFGEINEKSYGVVPYTLYKFEDTIVEQVAQSKKKKNKKTLKKSKLGNIKIELDGNFFILFRVDDVVETVKELRKIVSKNTKNEKNNKKLLS